MTHNYRYGGSPYKKDKSYMDYYKEAHERDSSSVFYRPGRKFNYLGLYGEKSPIIYKKTDKV